MPSASLLHWQNDRMPCLEQIDLQCAACVAAAPPNAYLIDENLRGYVVLLSAHSQGSFRDMYTDSTTVIAIKVRRSLNKPAPPKVRRIPAAKQRRLDQLLEKNSEGFRLGQTFSR